MNPKPAPKGCRTFTCALCKQEYVQETSDAEAYAEARKNFPGVPGDEMVELCDDCFEMFMEWYREQPESKGGQ